MKCLLACFGASPREPKKEGKEDEKSGDLRSKRGAYLIFDHSAYPDTVVLKVRKEEFIVSASYLALTSSFFHNLFYGPKSAGLKKRYELDYDSHTFGDLLDFVYPCYKKTRCCGECADSSLDRLNLALQLKWRPAVQRIVDESSDSKLEHINKLLEVHGFDKRTDPLLVTDAFPDFTTVVLRGGVSVVISATTLSLHSPTMKKMLYDSGSLRAGNIDVDPKAFETILRAITGKFPKAPTIDYLDGLSTLGMKHLHDVTLFNMKAKLLARNRLSAAARHKLMIHMANQPDFEPTDMKIFLPYFTGDFEEDVLAKCESLSPEGIEELRGHYDEMKKEQFQLFVRGLKGETSTYECCPSYSVADLKLIIELKQSFARDIQRLIFAGQQLDDEKTLSHYKISKECSLHLVGRLRGC